MYEYKIESISLRSQGRSAHGCWDDDELIPDTARGEQLWPHARPGRPAVMWVQHDSDPEPVPLHIVGFGADVQELVNMIGTGFRWGTM